MARCGVMLSLAAAVAASAAAPATNYYNGSLLAYAKQLVQAGDASVTPAYEALLAAADKAMRQAPLSVTQKYNASLYPFKMGPREYASIGFYMWPCNMLTPQPANCNASTGLPWADWDGHISPFVDSFDLDIWGAAQGAIGTLGLAYYFSGNESYATHAALLARTWFTDPELGMLPELNHGQFVPGVNTGRGTGIIDFSEYLSTGFLDSLILLRGSQAWSSADETAMQAWAGGFVDWLLTSPVAQEEARSTNNHKAYFEAQLLHLALYAGNASLAATRAATEGQAVLDGQIAADGELPMEEARTRSNHYVSFCLHAYLGLAQACSRAGADLWSYVTTKNHSSIRMAIEWMRPYSNGSQPWPFQNLDGPAFSWSELYDVYTVAAYAYPQDAAALALAAATTVNATGPADLRRLVWPWPPPGVAVHA